MFSFLYLNNKLSIYFRNLLPLRLNKHSVKKESRKTKFSAILAIEIIIMSLES